MSQLANPLEVLKSLSEATSLLIKKISQSVGEHKSTDVTGHRRRLNKRRLHCHLQPCTSGMRNSQNRTRRKNLQRKNRRHRPIQRRSLTQNRAGEFTPIEMGDSEKLNVGQYVLALANPFNRNQPTATSGMVTSVNSTIRGWRGATAMENVIATDAQLNPGFSGGPLIDVNGKLIGINTAYVWQRGIAIPVNKVKGITDRLMTGRVAQRGYLGIIANTVAIPEEIAEATGLEQETGVMIFSVEAGSPARKAGLAMGDVLVKFNGKPVTEFYDLPRLLNEDVIDKETKLTIIRRENLIETAITPTIHGGEED